MSCDVYRGRTESQETPNSKSQQLPTARTPKPNTRKALGLYGLALILNPKP